MRGVSSGFTVITAHQDPNANRWLDWDALARTGTTLVILMGASRTALISDRLISAGMDGATPVAVVRAATTTEQDVQRTTLVHLPELEVVNPSTLVVGSVAAHSVLDLPALSDPIKEGPVR
jgi:uroporphyrin-III C-methyltransferase